MAERILPEKSDHQNTGRNVAGSIFNPMGPVVLFEDKGHISTKNMREIRNFVEDNGRLPTESEIKEISGVQLYGRRGDEFYKAATQYATAYVDLNPDLKEQIDAAGEESIPEYYWDESKIHEQGTKEGDLFDFYKGMGDAQSEIGQAQTARSERDMQTEMAGQRTQLLDEIRKRRTNQLRSGLSSAQVANEEIQMLLMGQQAQQQTAQQHFGQRSEQQAQQQMNPFMAELQARQHIQGGHQGTSAFSATGVTDPIQMAQRYGTQAPATQAYTDHLTGLNKDDK